MTNDCNFESSWQPLPHNVNNWYSSVARIASEWFRLSRAQQTAISVMMMSGAGEVTSNKTPH